MSPFQYFDTTEQLRAVVPTAADVKLEQLASYVESAEAQLLAPVLGPDVLAQLHAGGQDELLKLLRPAVGSYAFRLYASKDQRKLTSNGSQNLSQAKDTASTGPLIVQHLAALEADARAQLDGAVLPYLEARPEAYAAWHASPFCSLLADAFFQSAPQLEHYNGGPLSRAAFRAKWPAIEAAELNQVQQVLGYDLYQRLLAAQHAPEHRPTVELVRTVVAGYALADPLLREAADSALVMLRYTLQRNLATYPEFATSPSYAPPQYDNDGPSRFYAAF